MKITTFEDELLKEEDIQIKFNEPSQFFALREQQIFQLRYDNFNNMSQNDLISNTFAQKVYLDWNDNQILANMAYGGSAPKKKYKESNFSGNAWYQEGGEEGSQHFVYNL